MDEAGGRLVELGVLVGDPNRRPVDVGADRKFAAGQGRGDGQHAGAGADVQHLVEAARLDQVVVGDQAADSGAMVAGAEGRAGFDAQVHGIGRGAALVMGAEHEEPARAHRRQARQRHGQPVGVGELLDHRLHVGEFGQGGDQAVGFFGRGREGVDPPDVAVLVLFQDRIGRPFQQRIGVDRFGGGFGHGARAAGDDLNGVLAHARRLEAGRAKGEGAWAGFSSAPRRAIMSHPVTRFRP